MTDKRLSPKVKVAQRQAKNKREAERLIKKIDSILYHHSPGIWEWIKETAGKVGDAVGDAWDWVNRQVDTYIWDTTTNEAALEGWVRNTFNIPDQEGKGFVGEAWDRVAEVITGVDTDTDERVTDAWDAITGWGGTVLTGAKDTLTGIWDSVFGALRDIFLIIKDAIMAAWDALGVTVELVYDAIASIPMLLVGFGELITGLFTIDEETFVEDSLRLVALNQKLAKIVEKQAV